MSFKINSGTKIFDIIEILAESPASVKEICLKLKLRGIEADKKAASKYLRTLKRACFDITKESGCYNIIRTPFEAEFDEECQKGAEIIFTFIGYLFKNNETRDIEILKLKLFDLLKKQYEAKDKENLFKNNIAVTKKISENLLILNKYADNPVFELKILYKNKNMKVEPKEIKFNKNGIFLYCRNKTNKKKSFLRVEYINKITPNKTKNAEITVKKNGTIFKITGSLMKNYILRKGETAKYCDNQVLVTNVKEEKEELFSRLIKYRENCEVVYPLSDREKFIEKIEKLIEYYKSI